jgi:5-methylcytosine-specific restriction enzyme A
MRENEIENICALIHEQIGIRTKGAVDPSGPRYGLSFWFENYNRGDGPIFSIRPSGLRRHVVAVKFGPYAAPCINHINSQADGEAFLTANAFIGSVSQQFETTAPELTPSKRWRIESSFMISATRKLGNQRNSLEIYESVKSIMIPFMAALSELIGYEESESAETVGDEEGRRYQALVTRRERSSRNRLLCLSIHGDLCFVCGKNPNKEYSVDIKSIIEVHHVEPLSMAGEARLYNPSTDLIPICPNCHSAIHKKVPPYTPAELRSMLVP